MFVITHLDDATLAKVNEQDEDLVAEIIGKLDAMQLVKEIIDLKRNNGPINGLKWSKFLQAKLEALLANNEMVGKTTDRDVDEIESALAHLSDKGQISSMELLAFKMGKRLRIGSDIADDLTMFIKNRDNLDARHFVS